MSKAKKKSGPKILFFDIETKYIEAAIWRLFDENISLDQINTDWSVLAIAAKWCGEDKIMYKDQRNSKNLENDKPLLKFIWDLLDECDIVVSQNGKRFDIPKLNARFVLNGFQPPSSFKHIDTCQIAKSKFGFTSNKLQYLSEKLDPKNKKSSHKKFPGFSLWKECVKGNQEAWKEMEQYNKQDVLALEAVYNKLQPWDSSINFNLYHDDEENVCNCGGEEFKRNGYAYTSSGKYQRFCCKSCGSETRSKVNLFSKEKKASLRVK